MDPRADTDGRDGRPPNGRCADGAAQARSARGPRARRRAGLPAGLACLAALLVGPNTSSLAEPPQPSARPAAHAAGTAPTPHPSPAAPLLPAEVRQAVRTRDDATALAHLARATASVDAQAALHYLEGRLAERVGDLERAHAAYARCAPDALSPRLREDLARRRARVAFHLGDGAGCLAALPTAPTGADHALAAACALEVGDLTAAQTHLAAAEGHAPALALLRAELHLRTGARDEAREVLRAAWLEHPASPYADAVEAALTPLGDPTRLTTPDERRRRAERLAAAHAPDAALAAYAALLPTAGADAPDLVRAQADVLFRARRYPEARLLYDRLAPDDPEAAFLAARALARADHDAEAITRLDALGRRDDAIGARARGLAATLALRLPGDAADDARAVARAREVPREAATLALAIALHHLARGHHAAAAPHLERACADRTVARETSCDLFRAHLAAARGEPEVRLRLLRAVAAAGPTTLHGLVARRALRDAGQPFVLPPLAPSAPVEPRPLTGDAAFFAALGLFEDAAVALARDVDDASLSPEGAASLAASFLALDDPGRAFDVARRALRRNPSEPVRVALVRLVHPRPFEDELRAHAAAFGLDPAYVYGTMRTESGFDPLAESRVGALGLLQLMPATARRAAERAGLARFEPATLFDPRENLRLGLVEMGHLAARYDGVVPWIAAAYNAGTTKVDLWRAEAPGAPLEVALERIPFEETHRYVRRVLGHAAEYHRLAGDPDRALDLLGTATP